MTIRDNRTEIEFPWQTNLYILWVAQFIAMIGMSACVPFLPLYVRELGVINLAQAQLWSGIIYAAPFFLAVIVTPIWGALSDGKYGKKLMVVRAILGLAIAMFLMGFAQNIWHLLFLRVLQGGISGFIAASLALVSASAPEKQSGYAISLMQTSISCGAMVGPFFGGILADHCGVRRVFLIVSILCCISAVIIIRFVREKKSPPSNQHHNSVWDNLQFMVQAPFLRRLLLFIMLCQAGAVLFTPILPYYLEALHAPAEYLGTITGSMTGIVGLLTTICAPVWGKRTDRKGYAATLKIALPCISISLLLQSLATWYWQLFPLRVMMGIFSGAVVPILYAALSKNSPPEIRGGIMGLASSSTLMGNLIGPLTGSWIAFHWGMHATFVVSSMLIFVVFLGIMLPQAEGKTTVATSLVK